MPTLVILATSDTALADSWERQLAPGRVAMRMTAPGFSAGTTHGFAAVVVLDGILGEVLAPALARFPTIYVGEPGSLPYEQARMSGRARVYLSYEESSVRLGELLPLIEEVADKQSMIDLLIEKSRRMEVARPPARVAVADTTELWDFFEGAVENLETRDRLVAEFRRASRHILRASHAVFFLREASGFRADRGTSFFPTDDPLVAYFELHPAVIDGTNWDGPTDPVAELAVRNRLALWGARLLIPVHDNGQLLGLVALGVRDDGQAYDEADRSRAVFFARLLRHLLAKAAQFGRLHHLADQANLGAKYLPSTLVLGPNEGAPRHLPLVVRETIGQTRRTREVARVTPSEGQPFRVSAGIVAETGGVWAFWEEASGELHDASARDRAGRRFLLRELGLTLSHELGNALVSLATFRFSNEEHPLPRAIIEAAKSDVVKLEHLNRHLALMQTLDEADSAPVDIRDLIENIGHALGLRVEVGPVEVTLEVSKKLLEFALRSLIETITENRGELGARDLTLQLRSTGSGVESTALISLKGKILELEGILPEPVEGGVPNQGRMGVFLAKEILRLHHGEIHAGPGMEGTEILISVRKW